MSLANLSAQQRSILVAEDDAAVRNLIVRHLRHAGYDVVEAGDAHQALVHARVRGSFDCVLTDIHMPGGLSGLELARLLLARAPLKPVIVITGDADERLARQALSQGASGYLLKPFELFELDAVVEQALSRLALVETTQTLARSEAVIMPRGDSELTTLPAAWLRLADERSGAGNAHGYRVERIADTIAERLPEKLQAQERNALGLGARAHELGRILGSATRDDLSLRTAQLLADMSMHPEVVKAVRGLHEHWDGSGGPDGLAGPAIPLPSRVLAAADALDHHAVMQMQLGLPADLAAEAGVQHVLAHAGTVFDPGVTAALDAAEETILAIWTLSAAWISD